MSKKKSTSLLDRFLFIINSLIAILLIFAYFLPYISPIKAPSLAVLSLFFPVIFLANVLFAIFWLIRLKRYFLLSTITLLCGFGYFSNIYKVSGKEIIQSSDLSLMSYNVRMFNHYGWSDKDSVAIKMYQFINSQKPDVLVIQELYDHNNIGFRYPYQYIKTRKNVSKFGLGIYSKYPIVHSGSFNLEDSANNIIYTDILKNNDTIRIYNIHLESLKLDPEEENFGEKNSDRLMQRMKQVFKKQGHQVERLLEHQNKWKGKSIICGDMNNTGFSWVYNQLSKDRQDAFKVAGKGTGSTFDYFYPLRIDYILPDESFAVNHYKTFDIPYSDHFPILARLQTDSE
jgi:endonuclease/exonuclease/phosphatase family metal-dependent hydrolase